MPANLRDALTTGPMIVAPGAYDGLTARMVARHGFPAVYMTGAGTSVAHGYPDYGLLTMTEMVENAARMTAAAGIPVIADADTGYGNELNVIRAVGAFARAGVAAIHIEDQTFPKRCGHLAGKEIVDRSAWLRKIRAAVDCRPSPDLLIIARTDARAVAGLEEAVERANAALAVGADAAFVEAPVTEAEIAAVPAAVNGPCLYNAVPGGRSPAVSLADLEAFGYRIVIFPTALLGAVVAACDRVLAGLTAAGAATAPALASPGADPGHGPAALFRQVGAEEWDRLRERYGDGGLV
ncbi:MAG TPA: isocitrate lyase/PEP mutase family protein [Streptosporangiaceae bacterium]|nr:isocitrate lyase/PEP mutase family protein [Streptosporangiaceae bacterium]